MTPENPAPKKQESLATPASHPVQTQQERLDTLEARFGKNSTADKNKTPEDTAQKVEDIKRSLTKRDIDYSETRTEDELRYIKTREGDVDFIKLRAAQKSAKNRYDNASPEAGVVAAGLGLGVGGLSIVTGLSLAPALTAAGSVATASVYVSLATTGLVVAPVIVVGGLGYAAYKWFQKRKAKKEFDSIDLK